MVVFPSRPEDTSADAARAQIALLRAAPISRRMGIAWALSARAISAARAAIARAEPDLSDLERDLRFVEVHYGRELARAVREGLARRSLKP